MDRTKGEHFLRMYSQYRYIEQKNFYRSRTDEFSAAQMQATTISIILMFLTSAAGVLEVLNNPRIILVCLLAAAILPVLATIFTAYNALYGYEQQAKLYLDTIHSLDHARKLDPDMRHGLDDAEFKKRLKDYVDAVEDIFQVEQGQWGQLAKDMKPSEI